MIKVSSADVFVRNSSDRSTRNVAEETGAVFCKSLQEVVENSDIVFFRGEAIFSRNSAG